VDEVPEPKVTDPLDVLVRVGAAGLCRTDLHIFEGQWEHLTHPELPFILGHENAGWFGCLPCRRRRHRDLAPAHHVWVVP
jgi:D-arabinose 1-dehydrogenase-like Zn-dependent alcohol dehydrogenase